VLHIGAIDYGNDCLGLWVERTRNPTTGAFDGVGIAVFATGGASASNYGFGGSLGFTGGFAGQWNYNETAYTLVPGNPADTALLSGDKQLYPWWFIVPEVRQTWGVFTIRGSEFGLGPLTFSAAPHPNVATKTYVTLGTATGPTMNNVQDATWRPAFLWE
jgi:hypothetical protein